MSVNYLTVKNFAFLFLTFPPITGITPKAKYNVRLAAMLFIFYIVQQILSRKQHITVFFNISYYARFQSLVSGVTIFAPKSVHSYAMLLLMTV